METGRYTSTKTTMKIHNEFINMFTGIGCLRSTFSLRDTKPYQALGRHVAYRLQVI